MNKLIYAFIFSSLFPVSGALAQKYEVPPSSSTYGDVPVISDEAMKECVKLYNEMKWLTEEIEATEVDRYSRNSVNAYNRKVRRQNEMNKSFNADCAGKQSYSAHQATQDLNKANDPN